MPPDDAQGGLSIRMTGIILADVAQILTKAGGKPVTEEMIREDLAAGAPLNPDGTLNLIHYAAWLVRELSDGD